MRKYLTNPLIWLVPIALLIIKLQPTGTYLLVVQIVVSLTAAVIIYLSSIGRSEYYLIWIVVFALIIVLYNPIIPIHVIFGLSAPLNMALVNIITAVIYFINWHFCYRQKKPPQP